MDLPLEFVRDLGRVCAECTGPLIDLPHLPPRFCDDLARVAEELDSDAPSLDQLRSLQFTLERLTSDSNAVFQAMFTRLPSDHPAKCGISLFGTMEHGRFEVAHTRTLAWLLDPAGSHGFGDRLLRALLRKVDAPDMTLDGVIVCPEQFCGTFGGDDAGRADVWVEGRLADSHARWLVVIEAKVDALESTGQLARYDREIGKRPADFVRRVFLTPDGRPPDGGNGQWKPVSFAELVRWFWSESSSLTDRPGYHFLRYYLAGVMRDILDLPTGNNPDRNRHRLIGFLKAEGEAHGAG